MFIQLNGVIRIKNPCVFEMIIYDYSEKIDDYTR